MTTKKNSAALQSNGNTVQDRDAQYAFLSADLDNYLLLMANTSKITNNITFLHLKNKFITCSLYTPEGKKAKVDDF